MLAQDFLVVVRTVLAAANHVTVTQVGFQVNHKNAKRIYAEKKLQVYRRGGRKRALGTRKPMKLAQWNTMDQIAA